jgi:hypothetical protein
LISIYIQIIRELSKNRGKENQEISKLEIKNLNLLNAGDANFASPAPVFGKRGDPERNGKDKVFLSLCFKNYLSSC